MDFLAAEIARKRKEIATTKASGDSPNKKYIRQKDVAAERDKRYLEEQALLTAEREAKAAAKLEETRAREAARLAREERLRREKEVKLPEADVKKVVGDDEVQERLRELEEPRVLFGETVEERRGRLEDVEMRIAIEKKRAARMAAKAEEAPELERLDNLRPDADELRIKLGDVKGNPNRLYDQLYQYFKVICQEWTKSMEERDEEIKDSPEGKDALRIHLQCLEDFRPLFRALKRKVRPHQAHFLGGQADSRIWNQMSFRCLQR
jgi:pre-mRNA-splicing factor 18